MKVSLMSRCKVCNTFINDHFSFVLELSWASCFASAYIWSLVILDYAWGGGSLAEASRNRKASLLIRLLCSCIFQVFVSCLYIIFNMRLFPTFKELTMKLHWQVVYVHYYINWNSHKNVIGGCSLLLLNIVCSLIWFALWNLYR